MTAALFRLGRWCARHAVLVIVLWLVGGLAIIGANRVIPGSSGDTVILEGTDSGTAQQLLNRAFPGTAADATPIVLHAQPLPADVAAAVAEAVAQVPEVSTVIGPDDDPDLLSANGETAIVRATVVERFAGDVDVGKAMLTAARTAAGPDVQVEMGGFLGRQLSVPDTRLSEALGVLAAIIILMFTLRRVAAAVIPLVAAATTVAIGLAIIGLLGRLVFIPDVAPTLGTMLGLGVGIDYALFLVSRHRALLAEGYAVDDAVGRTSGTAGAGMVFAGCTLIAAVCGLAFTGLSFLAWLGIAAAVVVAIAVLASLTLVPALLGLAKHRVVRRGSADAYSDAALDGSRWGRLGAFVTRRPWRFAIGSSLILLVLAIPATTLSVGIADASTLPESTTANQADQLIRAGFGDGAAASLVVVLNLHAPARAPENAEGDGDPRAEDPRLIEVQAAIAATDGVVSTDRPVVSTDGGVAVINVVPEGGPGDPRTSELVEELRSTVLPEVTADQGMSGHVGGVTAGGIDLSRLIAQRTPWFIVGVVLLAFVLLMVAYRSLVIPIKAAAMNLLSIAAAYGVMTAVFQWGWGVEALGLDGPVAIESYVPMMIFAVLFGLSMDYEVFLLTAFREHWERTGDMTIAVRRGLASTGGIITSAALIMIVVFGSFILSEAAIVKIFGVGLATAILIDATIVRCLLVPAVTVLAAKGTWWLPRWLDVLLPHVHVEGDPAAIDAAERSEERPPRTLRGQRPRAILGGAAGVVASVLLLPALPGVPAGFGGVVALMAVIGVILALRGTRLGYVGTLAGVIVGAGLATLVNVIASLLVPADSPLTTLTVGVAVLSVAAIAAFALSPEWAMPVTVGAVALLSVTLVGPDLPAISMALLVFAPIGLTLLVTAAVAGPSSSRPESVDVAEPERVGPR